MQQPQNPSKGFITVATKRETFLISAHNLCQSILDHYEDAKVTLFTEQRFIDDPKMQHHFTDFDQVIATPGGTTREKMWGLANTPYDITFYLDADTEIVHTDIANVFDNLEDHDMVYVNLTKQGAEHFAEWSWGPNLYDDGWKGIPDHLAHCGGVVLYDNRNSLVKEFMNDWYDLYLKQRDGQWNPKAFENIRPSFRQWDQLTLWWLLYHSPKYKSIKWNFFKDNYRWNYFSSFGYNTDGTHNCHKVDPKRDYWKTNGQPVVNHYSSWMDKFGNKGFLLCQ